MRAGPGVGLPERVVAAVTLQVLEGLTAMAMQGCTLDAYDLRPSFVLLGACGSAMLSGMWTLVEPGATRGDRARPGATAHRLVALVLSCLTGMPLSADAVAAVQGKRWHTDRLSPAAQAFVRAVFREGPAPTLGRTALAARPWLATCGVSNTERARAVLRAHFGCSGGQA